MKQNSFLFPATTLLLSLVSCQQQPTSETTITAPAEAVTLSPVQKAVIDTTQITATSALAPETRQFLAKYNVGSLLLRQDEGPLNGFIGPDHYRIEIVFTKVTCDSLEPANYRVEGKSRFKKNILPFRGCIVIDQVIDQPKVTKQEQIAFEGRANYENQPNAYSAFGHFTLREDSLKNGAGLFKGNIFVDFAVNETGLFIHEQSPRSASKYGGITFEGNWTSFATRQSKLFACAYYIWSYGETVLKNFNVGERGPEVNPKYAKLGWDTYWENEEWWAGPVTARAAVPDSR